MELIFFACSYAFSLPGAAGAPLIYPRQMSLCQQRSL